MRFVIMTLLLLASTAKADFAVTQEIIYKNGITQENLDLTWYVHKGAFRAELESSLSTAKKPLFRHFVFDGNHLWVCANLSSDQWRFLANLQSNTMDVGTLQNGVCQKASWDFALRFALYPYEAMLDPIVANSQTLGIQLHHSRSELTGTVGKLKGQNCANFKRFQKYEASILGQTTELFHKSCHAPKIKWRDKLVAAIDAKLNETFADTSKNYYVSRTLRSDLSRFKGMSLAIRSAIKRLGQEAPTVEKIDVKTHKVETTFDLGLTDFPVGYEKVSEELVAKLRAMEVKPDNLRSNTRQPSLADIVSFFLIGGEPIEMLQEEETAH